MQMTFLTLFLGLISGQQSVVLTAGPEVAAVEIVVDGTRVARVEDPPWEAIVDFGPALLPHHLEARGLDARGREVATAEQWLNLPRPPAEVEIVIEKASGSAGRTVQLTWQSLTNDRPAAISLTLDGKPLALDADNRAALPPDSGKGSAHLLSAELSFAGGLAARQDLVLGGEFGDEVSTDLTAVAVRLRNGRELPPAARLQGWFTAAGKPLRAGAVEAGPAHLMVVRDPDVPNQVRAFPWFSALTPHRFALRRGTRLNFVSTSATSFVGTGLPSQLFGGSQEIDAGQNGLLWLLANATNSRQEGTDRRLADAVAVAAIQADSGSGPRAVLLVLGSGAALDQSLYDGAAVRRYLAAVHVPLFVWKLGEPDGATKAKWGAVEDISTWSGMGRAWRALDEGLAAQRVVLVEGRLLPQSIALSSAAGAAVDPISSP